MVFTNSVVATTDCVFCGIFPLWACGMAKVVVEYLQLLYASVVDCYYRHMQYLVGMCVRASVRVCMRVFVCARMFLLMQESMHGHAL